MSHVDSSPKPPSNKRTRLDIRKRSDNVLALTTSGLTQKQIAAKLNISQKSVQRHQNRVKPALQTVSALIDDLDRELSELQTPKQIAEKYVDLSKSAKNEAIQLAAQDRILDLRGVVTQKELVRTRRDEQSQPAPMFILSPTLNVDVVVNQGMVKHDAQSSSVIEVSASKDEES